MQERLQAVQKAGDSLGGIVFCQVDGVPPGLGNPIYEKIGASLAKGILSIPACKGISFGDGFDAAKQTGSAHNDLPIRAQDGSITMRTNHAGGMLGGISTGMPITFSSAFKPTSSINQNQETCSFAGEKATLSPHPLARHDPCVAIRAVPVVEAMTALVLVDAYLLQNLSRI